MATKLKGGGLNGRAIPLLHYNRLARYMVSIDDSLAFESYHELPT